MQVEATFRNLRVTWQLKFWVGVTMEMWQITDEETSEWVRYECISVPCSRSASFFSFLFIAGTIQSLQAKAAVWTLQAKAAVWRNCSSIQISHSQ